MKHKDLFPFIESAVHHMYQIAVYELLKCYAFLRRVSLPLAVESDWGVRITSYT